MTNLSDRIAKAVVVIAAPYAVWVAAVEGWAMPDGPRPHASHHAPAGHGHSVSVAIAGEAQ